jgi:hypothetical protein
LECGGSTPLSFFWATATRAGRAETKEEKKESGVEPPHSKEIGRAETIKRKKAASSRRTPKFGRE